ncbi:hypothetical protein MRX96_037396 [Rhipicephalus microplus]
MASPERRHRRCLSGAALCIRGGCQIFHTVIGREETDLCVCCSEVSDARARARIRRHLAPRNAGWRSASVATLIGRLLRSTGRLLLLCTGKKMPREKRVSTPSLSVPLQWRLAHDNEREPRFKDGWSPSGVTAKRP